MRRGRAVAALFLLGALAGVGGPRAAEAGFLGANGAIAFSGPVPGKGRTVYVADARTGKLRRIGQVSQEAAIAAPVWSPDGRRLALVTRNEVGDRLTIFTRDGRISRRIDIPEQWEDDVDSAPAWSPTGNSLLVPGDGGLYLVRLGPQRTSRLGSGLLPSWSPTGERFAFFSRDENVEHSFSLGVSADGGCCTRTLDASVEPEAWATDPLVDPYPDPASPPSWSPQGARIAYESHGDVHVADALTRRVVNLTRSPRSVEYEATWSPDGRLIAYLQRSRDAGERETELYVVDPATGRRVRLTRNLLAEESPAWSPDSRRLAYAEGELGIFERTIATGRVRRLTRPLCQGEHVRGLVWSPRRAEIAFVRDLGSVDYNVYEADIGGGRPRPLAVTCAQEYDPTWSPDGARIAYVRNSDVWTMSGERLGGRQVVADAWFPSWSRDGGRLVYTGPAEGPDTGATDIFVVPVNGGSPRRLTHGEGYSYGAAWSPTTDEIAFTSVRAGGGVYLIGADGRNERRLTEEGYHPSWSPDGTRLVFSYASDLYTMRSDGSDRVRVVTTPDPCWELEFPRWSPDGRRLVFSIHDNLQEAYLLGEALLETGKVSVLPWQQGFVLRDESGLGPADWQPLPSPPPSPVLVPAEGAPSTQRLRRGCRNG